MKVIAPIVLLAATALASDLGPKEITIEALIDGGSILHITSDRIYWENGDYSKPGRWGNRNEPTIINGIEWAPKWSRNKENTGRDKSDPYRMAIGNGDFEVQLLAVTKERGGTGIEKRTDIAVKKTAVGVDITIPDPESEGRWYKVLIKKRVKSLVPASNP